MKQQLNREIIICILFATVFYLVGCNEGKISIMDHDPIESDSNIVISDTVFFRIDESIRYQEMQHFGASDAWSLQFVGKNWSLEKRREIARLLFSKDYDVEGNPEGIGLTAWRFNIGAGSTEQGEGSMITDEWRRAESFLTQDGSYDWTKHEGQRWFLKAAQEFGVNVIIGFVNSPPVLITKNNKAYSSDGKGNLLKDNYINYAVYLADIVEKLESLYNISLDYISPFNEPQWDWKCCGQEGSGWNNNEIAQISREIDSVFQKRGISCKIDITEAAQINFLFEGSIDKSNQLYSLFNDQSVNYLGDRLSISKNISGHSYFTTWDSDYLIRTRKKLYQTMMGYPGLSFWMSEYTLLEDNLEIQGNGRDLSMKPALYMARVLISDLLFAKASAWHWWLAVSPYDYKDGLIYIDYNKHDGTISESKLLWALGNFSKFIHPGMIRIGLIRSDVIDDNNSIDHLTAIAFLNPNNSEKVIVFVNQDPESKNICFSKFDVLKGRMKKFITSDLPEDNLRRLNSENENVQFEHTIPGRSIVTIIFE